MKSSHGDWSRTAVRLLRDPTIHFFVLGALIFLVHRFIAGDPRTIVITPAVRTDLARRLQDQWGRQPDNAELDAALQNWKSDEALYREALSEGLDREDPMVRTILINKLCERAALKVQVPEPSDSDLDQWVKQHRDLYETPYVYEHEYMVFPKAEPGAAQQREKYERALKAGAIPAALGMRTVAAKVRREQIEQEFGPELAERICNLPVGDWHSLEGENRLLLVRMIQIEGGLPNLGVVHDRLVMDWKSAIRHKAVERATQAIMARYRFKESDQ